MQTKTIYTPSLVILALEIQEYTLDGYKVDPENPPFLNGWCYELVMYKDETRAAVLEAFKEDVGTFDFSVVAEQASQKRGAGRPARNVK